MLTNVDAENNHITCISTYFKQLVDLLIYE